MPTKRSLLPIITSSSPTSEECRSLVGLDHSKACRKNYDGA